ncbi:MAG: tetratricopeptide repeat protein [Candidatus Sumerlaeaceae bacterium]
MRATAKRDWKAARKKYEQLVSLDPQNGFPLYARFLARTKQTTAVKELLSRDTLTKLPPLVRARTFLAAGDTTQALELFAQANSDAEFYAATVALYNILREAGDTTRSQQRLIAALRSANLAPAQRLDLFERLLRTAHPTIIADVFCEVITSLGDNSVLDFPDLRQFAAEALANLDAKPGYAKLRADLSARAPNDPAAAWLDSLAWQRRGDTARARTVLENALHDVHLTTNSKALLLEELAQLPGVELDRAEQLYNELLPLAKNPDRVRLRLAGILFKAKRYDEVCRIIEAIDRQKLDESDRKLAANMRLTALAKVRPARDVVAAFEEEARGKDYLFLRELAEAPFALLPETSDHLKYREALQARLRETTAPTELLVLMMSTENQLRSPDAIVAALEAYTQARPTDFEALNEYAIAASQRAYSLVVGPHETTPTLETVHQNVDKAARALWQVAKNRPYATEPYLRLMELYRVIGDREKAIGVAQALAKHTSATAEEIHLAAYLLDEANFTTDSLAYYHEAIQRDPQNGRFKMNLANAYRKLGRDKEAMALYRELFERGSYGRQHHIHQLTEDAYALAEKLGQIGELIRFWKSLATRSDVPQRDEFLVHVGSLLVEKKRFADAVEFLDLARRLYPEQRDEIEPHIAKAAAMQGDLERAKAIYLACAQRAATTDEKIEVLTDLGRLLAAAGDFAAARDHWEKLAEDFPDHPRAARALILAAQAASTLNNRAQAQQLLLKYLSRDRGDSEGERQAREFLDALSKQTLQTTPSSQK